VKIAKAQFEKFYHLTEIIETESGFFSEQEIVTALELRKFLVSLKKE
jgi:hypothetical protein